MCLGLNSNKFDLVNVDRVAGPDLSDPDMNYFLDI